MSDEDRQDQESRGEQTVTVEDIGPARKCLTIEVPPERIEEKIDANFSRLKTESVLPGFRRGRAPLKLLQKRFTTSVRDEVRGQILSECYSQAIEDESLQVIGEPNIQDVDKIELPENGALTFKVEVEVSPNVTLPDLKGIKVNKPDVEATDADVAESIERLCKQMGKYEVIEDGVVEDDSSIKADVRVLAGEDAQNDADEISQHQDILITTEQDGKKKIAYIGGAGLILDGKDQPILGKKIGDEIRVNMTGPPNHENEQIKEQAITVVIHIKGIEKHTPCTWEELAKVWSLETEDQLKEKVKQFITERRQQEQAQSMHQQICDYLLESTQLDLPEGLTGRQTDRLLRREAMDLAYRGQSPQEIEQDLAKRRQGSEEEARHQLKLFFILDQAAKSLDIEVSGAEVNGRIASIAVQQGRRPEKMRQEMQRSGELEQLFIQVRDQKTLDKILEDAVVTEAQPDNPDTPEAEAKTKKPRAKKSKAAPKKK